MSKPYSQPGEKGTDTNQASEDELRQSLASLFYDDCYEYMLSEPDLFDVGAIDAAIDLIRTEKLKTKIDLLKTIRRSYPKRRTLQGNAQSKLTLADIDRLIGETKLEAEL